MKTWIQRGDIYYADLRPVTGSEQGGVRPVIVLQNNIGNRFSPTVIVAAITSKYDKNHLPTHILIDGQAYGLRQNSTILLEQMRTLDRRRLREYIGKLDDSMMRKVDYALAISIGLLDMKDSRSGSEKIRKKAWIYPRQCVERNARYYENAVRNTVYLQPAAEG